MRGRMEVFENGVELVRAAAGKVSEIISCAVSERGVASIALSGGTTPRRLYELLGSDEFRSRIDWNGVHVFWGDERCVPPYMPESNFRMVNETLFKRITVPQANIHRIMGERAPEDAAMLYEQEIRRVFNLREGVYPQFDVMLLGLGEDGHTASLFPNTQVLYETTKLTADVHVEKLMSHRVTLTLPVINNARNIIFLVSGKNKAEILYEVSEEPTRRYPAQLVEPANGMLYWLVDKDAAMAVHPERNV